MYLIVVDAKEKKIKTLNFALRGDLSECFQDKRK